MSSGLGTAEEIVDQKTRIEHFRGREIDFATGRVVLHAWSSGGGALCGRRDEQLTPIGRPWDASYLPHLPRCRGCVAPGIPGGLRPHGCGQDSSGGLAPGLPASGADVRAASGTAAEIAGVTGLRGVIAEHDLRRWMFTDLVASTLATFLHEQLHWLEGLARSAAASGGGPR